MSPSPGTDLDASTLIGLPWSELRRRAQELATRKDADLYDRAVDWYNRPEWEIRFFAVSILGALAGGDERALSFLFRCCGKDSAWQVNEGLAMAFDDYCSAVGYEEVLPVMQTWLAAPFPNLRRAVSEGLRPWTAKKRAYFAARPQAAIELLATLRDDESRYVQESVGNALRDISRTHFDLVLTAVRAWVDEDPRSRARRTIARFALKNAVKEHPELRQIYHGPTS